MSRTTIRISLVACPLSLVASALVLLAVVAQAHSADAQSAGAQNPNSFNRLHTSPGDRNAPPASDGLHDPAIEGTQVLQPPREAFEALPKAPGGNYVNWGEALKTGKIAPRYDKDDASAKPELLDLDIVREVKGTTPDAVFPHAAHAEWIDCATCHPAIFEASKGANTMTMGEIMTGQKCGVCHGTVAFPVAECRRCHYGGSKGGTENTASKTVAKPGRRPAKKGLRLPWQD